jgi:hypothetical protein
MDESLIKTIKNNFQEKSSEELLDILKRNNNKKWSQEAFRAIQIILEERGIKGYEHKDSPKSVTGIIQYYNNIIEDSLVSFEEDIPPKKLKNALNKYAQINNSEIPLMLIDTSFLSNGSAGVILTETCIYLKEISVEPKSFRWRDVISISLSSQNKIAGKNKIYINGERCLDITGMGDSTKEQLSRMFQDILTLLNPNKTLNEKNSDLSSSNKQGDKNVIFEENEQEKERYFEKNSSFNEIIKETSKEMVNSLTFRIKKGFVVGLKYGGLLLLMKIIYDFFKGMSILGSVFSKGGLVMFLIGFVFGFVITLLAADDDDFPNFKKLFGN